jgi:endonuclease/exonuclease/phosphatase family metal-dependent hydrolase
VHTIALIIAATAIAVAPPSPAARPISLRVATYNVNWGNADLKELATAIQRADADVVCLQETTAASEELLRETFKAGYPHIRFQGHEGRFAAERFGFLSRLPLRNVRFVPPQHGLFGTYCADLDVRGQALRIVNVHLSPLLVRRGAGLRDAYAALRNMEQTHTDEARRILEGIDPDMPTIIAGDFNSLSTLQAPLLLKGAGFTDSFAAVTTKPDAHPTWRWRLRSGTWDLRIDYVFHSAHFTTKRSEVFESDASDHSLLVSELDLVPVGSPAGLRRD